MPSAEPLLDRLLETLRSKPLSRLVHGLRLFVSYNDGHPETNEVLLDNDQ